jgi:translation initiation factor 4G
MKEPDVVLVSELFIRVREKELCSPGTFEEGFNGLADILEDLSIDIPKAWTYFAIFIRGSGLDQDEARRERIVEKIMDADGLHGPLWDEFACIFSVCPVRAYVVTTTC